MAADPHAAGLERPAIDVQVVALAGGACLAFLVAAIAGLSAVYVAFAPNVPKPEPFPHPRVQTDEARQLHNLLAAQRQQLSEYAWTDRQKGLVRIPIERAMELLLEKPGCAYAPLAPPASARITPRAGTEHEITPSPSSGPVISPDAAEIWPCELKGEASTADRGQGP